MSGLPPGWVECTFDEVTAPVEMTGRNDPDRDIWYIDISSIDNSTNKITEPKHLRLSEAPSRARQKIQTGDVLFSTVRPYLRKIAAVAERYDGEIASTGFAVLRPAKGVDPGFLFYKSLSKDFVAALTGEQYGVSYPAVKDEQVRAQPFPLPPPEEQRRIAAKIDDLFAELDKGAASLRRAREQLRLYRQSVLKHAFEGKLTAHWRAANPNGRQSPETLLAQPNKGRKPRRKKQPENDGGARNLPEGWVEATVADIAGSIRYGYTASASKEPVGPRMLRITDIQDGRVNWKGVPYCKIENEKLDDFRLSPGNIVFARTGGTVGKSFIIRRVPEDAVFASYLIRISANRNMLPEYLYWFFQSGSYWEQIGLKKGGLQGNVNATALSALELPIAPLEEQCQIVAEIERVFSEADRLESAIDDGLAKVETLRQSILKSAFSGRLVPQNPADEPAAALLTRIRRAAPKPGKTGRKKPKRAKAHDPSL